MLKILYAASNNKNARIQLSRFLKAIHGKPYIIKIAAYKNSSPKNVSIDWTLDCLLNIFKPNHISLDNDNFDTYFDQIKYFNPDLIISDMEYFTSYAADALNITLWQCSSSLINQALTQQDKYHLGVSKKFSYLVNKIPLQVQRNINIVDNSNCRFVYSHLGDVDQPPILKNGFEWIRPYHSVGKISTPCQHNIVAGMVNNNKNIFGLLKKYADSIAFTEFHYEKYTNLCLKDIENQAEYFCNLKNSNLFVCEGQTSFLADAFYNNKYSIVWTNFQDLECVTNSIFSEYLKLSTSIYELFEDLNQFMNLTVNSNYNENIQYLHERIEEI